MMEEVSPQERACQPQCWQQALRLGPSLAKGIAVETKVFGCGALAGHFSGGERRAVCSML